MSQSQQVVEALRAFHPQVRIEIVPLVTTGDTLTNRSLAWMGGKGLFTRELEQALLEGRIDLAVHSYKDVPITMPLVDVSRLVVAAVPKREDPRDVLVTRNGLHLAELPEGAIVGTTSVRRRCQLLSVRPDLRIEPLRGNIDTRLRKLNDGCFDAIVLASAGLRRADLFNPSTMRLLSFDHCLPAAGQGALALQCRADDLPLQSLLTVLNDPDTQREVQAERSVVQALEGDCASPIAAHARVDGSELHLEVAVGRRDGMLPVFRASGRGSIDDIHGLVESVLSRLVPA